jgi:hypothetical protein
MAIRTGRFILTGLAALLSASVSSAQDEAKLKRRFRNEAPPAWDAFINFSRILQGTSTYEGKEIVGGKEESTPRGRDEFKQTNDGALRVQFSLRPDGAGNVIGMNPHYTFSLTKKKPHDGWAIADLKMSASSKRDANQRKEIQEEVEQYGAASCLRLWTLWLPNLVRDRDFKIKAMRTWPPEDGTLVRIDFDYPKRQKDYPNPGTLQITGGWMVLDPKHDWVLREYEIHHFHPDKWLLHRTIDVREGTDRHPIIKKTTLKIIVKQASRESYSSSEWNMWEDANLAIDQCSLSAFGLPEPDGVPYRASSRWYLWFIAIAAVSLIVGIYLLRHSGRLGTATPAP